MIQDDTSQIPYRYKILNTFKVTLQESSLLSLAIQAIYTIKYKDVKERQGQTLMKLVQAVFLQYSGG
ncbi:unnamed protein product [Paramecium pentaurelia]|uniref:Uncharacterized protein n=1 Tax=Paramecium pentaurelia TaxID=43138 RepID=A0A8S1YJ58_9CILI|nr:unnamed protein product [Paramecium pentaurelia]